MKLSIPFAAQVSSLNISNADPHADSSRRPRMSNPVSFLRLRTFLAAAVFLACTSGHVSAQEVNPNCVCNFNATKDYFPVKLGSDFAELFEIEYKKSYKKITVQKDGGGSIVTYAYLCGTPRPAEATEANSIQIPIDSAVVTSTTFLPLFNYLGKRSSIDYVAAGDKDELEACLRKQFDANKLSIGYDFSSVKDAIIANAKARTGEAPDVVFFDEYGYDQQQSSVSSSFGTHTKAFMMPQSNEPKPLGPLEWLEVVAALYNVEAEAQYVIDSIESRYICVKSLITDVTEAQRKKVLWMTNYQGNYGGAPPAAYLSSGCPGSFFCDMVEDAGGDFLEPPASLTDTTVAALADQADTWIYPDGNFYKPTAFGLQFLNGTNTQRNALFANVKVIKNQQVYDYLGANSQDWFNDRLAEPDVLLMDINQALWGSEYIADIRDTRYLRNIYSEPEADQGPRDPKSCPDVNAKLYTEWLTGPCAGTGVGQTTSVTPPLCAKDETTKPGAAASVESSMMMIMVAFVVLVFVVAF